MEYNIKKSRGFTLIESLVAITLLMIAVTGPLALASKGLAYSNYVRDEITAFYLANESIDVIRNIRDTNLRSGIFWQNIPDSSGVPIDLSVKCRDACYFDVWKNPADLKHSFDPTETRLLKKVCPSDGAVYFGYDFTKLTNSPGFPSDCSGTDVDVESPFKREVKIISVGLDEIRVTATVSWQSGSIDRNVIISENLFKLQ